MNEFKGAWRSLGTLAPEHLSALRRVTTIESIGSSSRIISVLLMKMGMKLQTKIEREKIIIDTLLGLSIQILNFSKGHGELTIAQIIKFTDANSKAVEKQLKALVDATLT